MKHGYRKHQMERWSVGALERGAHSRSAVVGKKIANRWEEDWQS